MNNTDNTLIKIEKEDVHKYRYLLDDFPYFSNYIEFALETSTPELWVNSIEEPSAALFYSHPAFFIVGDPDSAEIKDVLDLKPETRGIVVSNEGWEEKLEQYYGEQFRFYDRTHFDFRSLDKKHLNSLKKDLPEGFEIIQIKRKQAEQKEGIFYNNVIKRFFTSGEHFLKEGFGLCILDGEKMVSFACSEFPIRNNILEVSIRTEDESKYRQKGFSIALSIALLEYCLDHNIEPHWDAANAISAYMATKLGYTNPKKWKMYYQARDWE